MGVLIDLLLTLYTKQMKRSERTFSCIRCNSCTASFRITYFQRGKKFMQSRTWLIYNASESKHIFTCRANDANPAPKLLSRLKHRQSNLSVNCLIYAPTVYHINSMGWRRNESKYYFIMQFIS